MAKRVKNKTILDEVRSLDSRISVPKKTVVKAQVETKIQVPWAEQRASGVVGGGASKTSVSWSDISNPPSSFPPSGPAGGDLGGTYPNPIVVKINGQPPPAPILVDTRANILATSPTATRMAIATDTLRVYIADGTNWNETPIEWATRTSAPDMGFTQNSSRAGYGQNYVTDKLLANVQIGSNSKAVLGDGDIRVLASALQVYLLGAWQTAVTGFRFREVGGTYVLEHQPIINGEWIEIMSGNSETLSLSGLPMIQQYQMSMGAYQAPLVLSGGSF